MIDDEELSFYVDKNGQSVKCDILAMLPGENEFETYVAFFDDLDHKTDNVMQYAKIISNNGTYAIQEFEDDAIVEQLKEKVIYSAKDYIDKQMEGVSNEWRINSSI